MGKLADFVVLSGNPLENPEQIHSRKALSTIRRGQTVYRAPNSPNLEISP